jgi:hypothetical protein
MERMMSQRIKADGLDEAIIGQCRVTERVIYDVTKIVMILMERDGMTSDEALEFYEYNIEGAYVGEMTPIYMGLYYEE